MFLSLVEAFAGGGDQPVEVEVVEAGELRRDVAFPLPAGAARDVRGELHATTKEIHLLFTGEAEVGDDLLPQGNRRVQGKSVGGDDDVAQIDERHAHPHPAVRGRLDDRSAGPGGDLSVALGLLPCAQEQDRRVGTRYSELVADGDLLLDEELLVRVERRTAGVETHDGRGGPDARLAAPFGGRFQFRLVQDQDIFIPLVVEAERLGQEALPGAPVDVKLELVVEAQRVEGVRLGIERTDLTVGPHAEAALDTGLDALGQSGGCMPLVSVEQNIERLALQGVNLLEDEGHDAVDQGVMVQKRHSVRLGKPGEVDVRPGATDRGQKTGRLEHVAHLVEVDEQNARSPGAELGALGRADHARLAGFVAVEEAAVGADVRSVALGGGAHSLMVARPPNRPPNRVLDPADLERPEYRAIVEAMHVMMRVNDAKRGLRSCKGRHLLEIATFMRAHIQSLKHWDYPWAILHAELEPRSRVLDAGSGRGALHLYLAAQGHDVTALDWGAFAPRWVNRFSRGRPAHWWAQAMARAYGVRVRYQTSDVRALPFPEGTFDRVFCISVLEHLAHGDDTRAVRELLRVCAPEGRVVLTVDLALDDAPDAYTVGAIEERLIAATDATVIGLRDYTIPDRPAYAAQVRALFGKRHLRATSAGLVLKPLK